MDSLFPHDSLAGAVLEKHLSVRAAAEYSGYNEQYLRRLLRTGRLDGTRIGQVWLIKLASLEAHLLKGRLSRDQRYGPQGVTADFAKGVVS
jgi:excisionase family DNA binding protein